MNSESYLLKKHYWRSSVHLREVKLIFAKMTDKYIMIGRARKCMKKLLKVGTKQLMFSQFKHSSVVFSLAIKFGWFTS
jgi:hypothetical protein